MPYRTSYRQFEEGRDLFTVTGLCDHFPKEGYDADNNRALLFNNPTTEPDTYQNMHDHNLCLNKINMSDKGKMTDIAHKPKHYLRMSKKRIWQKMNNE